jgi:phenylpropionate dioxygenase-like ring-hydroxylating dioxygenase large terminal subunit
MTSLFDDAAVVQRILDHIDNQSTDLSDQTWREPVEHYRSDARFAAELDLVLRRYPTPFCPSAALPGPGSYLARDAAQTPILAVRDNDGQVRAFRNACRHRGTMLAQGAGCEKAFVCRYHGWTYGLDGALRHVPHEHGFPGLDKRTRGLVAVDAVEVNGIVFITQQASDIADAHLDAIPELFTPRHQYLGCDETEVVTNWKIVAEGFLEGYHIRSTHRDTFYPIQFDNLNVTEVFGRNSRIAFPYRRVGKLRAVAPAERSGGRHADIRVSPVPERDDRHLPVQHYFRGPRAGRHRPHEDHYLCPDRPPRPRCARQRAGTDAAIAGLSARRHARGQRRDLRGAARFGERSERVFRVR